MNHYTIGIDNGTTGTIGIIGPDGSIFESMPVKEALMGRVSFAALDDLLMPYDCTSGEKQVKAYLERPFTGSAMMINTTVLSARAFEATLIVLEQAGIGYEVVDSKEWQKAILGNVKGSVNLKKASMLRGMEMFPAHAAQIKKHKDADGLLIASHYHNR